MRLSSSVAVQNRGWLVPPLMKTTAWLSKRVVSINQFWLVKFGNRFNMSTPSHKGFFGSKDPSVLYRHWCRQPHGCPNVWPLSISFGLWSSVIDLTCLPLREKGTHLCIEFTTVCCHCAGRPFRRIPLLISSTGPTASRRHQATTCLWLVSNLRSTVLFSWNENTKGKRHSPLPLYCLPLATKDSFH